jgi:hypothetical protein
MRTDKPEPRQNLPEIKGHEEYDLGGLLPQMQIQGRQKAVKLSPSNASGDARRPDAPLA